MAEPGWHPDPLGRNEHRYFDGERWTDHVANQGESSVDPVLAIAPPQPATDELAPPLPRTQFTDGPDQHVTQALTTQPATTQATGPYPATLAYHPHAQTRRAGKTRNPWGVWLLSLITFGIYGWYWYYKINEETREYSPAVDVQPGIALLAYILGVVTCAITTIVTIVNSGGRISQCQQSARSHARCSGGLGLLFALLAGTHLVYYQSQLNKVWDQHGNPAPGTPI